MDWKQQQLLRYFFLDKRTLLLLLDMKSCRLQNYRMVFEVKEQLLECWLDNRFEESQ